MSRAIFNTLNIEKKIGRETRQEKDERNALVSWLEGGKPLLVDGNEGHLFGILITKTIRMKNVFEYLGPGNLNQKHIGGTAKGMAGKSLSQLYRYTNKLLKSGLVMHHPKDRNWICLNYYGIGILIKVLFDEEFRDEKDIKDYAIHANAVCACLRYNRKCRAYGFTPGKAYAIGSLSPEDKHEYRSRVDRAYDGKKPLPEEGISKWLSVYHTRALENEG